MLYSAIKRMIRPSLKNKVVVVKYDLFGYLDSVNNFFYDSLCHELRYTQTLEIPTEPGSFYYNDITEEYYVVFNSDIDELDINTFMTLVNEDRDMLFKPCIN